MVGLVDYRCLLREELVIRCRKNPSYSARAMARDIGLSAAFFSQVLNARRSLGEERAFRIAERMGWNASKQRLFLQLVRFEITPSGPLRETIREELGRMQASGNPFERIEGERLGLLSQWYYFAILELLEVEDSRAEPLWIARRLGISPGEVTAALARLRRLGLVEDRNGRLRPVPSYTTTGDFPSRAIRAYHCRMLDCAKRAITSHKVDSRDTSSITMAIDPSRLGEAAEKIRGFRRELMQFLVSGRKRAVYHLSIQLFRLDRG